MENKFPETLKLLLKQKGTTHAELAKVIGLQTNNISGYITGKARPNIDSLVKIASYFGVSTDYLLTGQNPENEQVRKDLGLDEQAIENLKAAGNGDFGAVWFILNTLLEDKRFYEELANAETLAIQYRSMYNFLIEQKAKGNIGELIDMSVALPAEKMRDYFLKFFNDFPKHLDTLAARQRHSVIDLHNKTENAESTPTSTQDMVESPAQ